MNGLPFLIGFAGLLVVVGLIARARNHNVGELFESVAMLSAAVVILIAVVQAALVGEKTAAVLLMAIDLALMLEGARAGRFAFTKNWWVDHQSSV